MMKDDENDLQVEEAAPPNESSGGCCKMVQFEGNKMAKGYNLLGMGRGAIVMSNVFLSTSFIYLASEAANCLEYNDDDNLVVDSDCKNRVYGMRPIALISNIAVISGLLSAFCMPVVGAMIDYTEHRTTLGMIVAALIGVVQAIQIGTVSSTWFPMAILQSFAGFLYQALVMVAYAFLPTIARAMGLQRMVYFTSTWVMTQFGSQASFLLVVILVSSGLILKPAMSSVLTAQVSQGINVAWMAATLIPGFCYLPRRIPRNQTLEEGQSLWTQGFVQNFRTIRKLSTRPDWVGLRWFFLTLVFAEAATNTFTTVAPTYLVGELGMSGAEVGIFFLITLLGSLPGTRLGAFVTGRTNPKTSWIICMTGLIVVANLGAFGLEYVPKSIAYLWGVMVGIFLGWFYPTENLYFSMIVPAANETELAGFFVYGSQIMGWLPPLIFSIIVEQDLAQKWGILVVTGFHACAIAGLCLPPFAWEKVVSLTSGQNAPPVDHAEEEEEPKEGIPEDSQRSSAYESEVDC